MVEHSPKILASEEIATAPNIHNINMCRRCVRPAPANRAQFSSVQSLKPIESFGGHEGRFSGDPLPVFSARGHHEQFKHRQGHRVFEIVRPVFPLPTTASPTLSDVLKDGFGEAIAARDLL